MPLSVAEYKVGQLYMIAKHSAENTSGGEGIEILTNEPCETEEHGPGQFTHKRIHLGSSLPGWVRACIPRVFYITEKAWNHFPTTVTVYTCSFLPRFSVKVTTTYKDDRGKNDEAALPAREDGAEREVVTIDISREENVPDKHKEDCPSLRKWRSVKKERGPLTGDDWMEQQDVIMTSYKVVEATFGVWGLQTRAQNFIHKKVAEVLLVGHIQAVAWLDEWADMSIEDVRAYEEEMNAKSNASIGDEAKKARAVEGGGGDGGGDGGGAATAVVDMAEDE